MSSRRYHSSRGSGSKWTGNQKCLAVICVILAGVTVAVFLSLVKRQQLEHPEVGSAGVVVAALFALTCPGIFAVVPVFMLWRSRAASRAAGGMKSVVRSQRYTGGGFSDLTIRDDQRLPRVCMRCGAHTGRVTPLRYENAHTEASPYDWSRMGPLIIFMPFFTILQTSMIGARIWASIEKRRDRRKDRGKAVEFRIPHCRKCSQVDPIVQRHFDFHGRNMIVDVHPAFREALQAQG